MGLPRVSRDRGFQILRPSLRGDEGKSLTDVNKQLRELTATRRESPDSATDRPLSATSRYGCSWPVRDFHLTATIGRCTTHTGHRDVNGRCVIVEPPFSARERSAVVDPLQPYALPRSRPSTTNSNQCRASHAVSSWRSDGCSLQVQRMTSSARDNTDCGIVNPSALAVLRLITSSNLVGCSTGRSPGLAPFRIRCT
jgi:hypothetical protein